MAEADGEPRDPADVIEPGSPGLADVLLVLLGAASALAVVVHLVQLFG